MLSRLLNAVVVSTASSLPGSLTVSKNRAMFADATVNSFGAGVRAGVADVRPPLTAGGDAGSFTSYLLNLRILGGVACYISVMVLFVAAFRKGGALTVLYPVYATTFIWASLIALLAYGTPIKPVNVAGMALLIAGMYLMGRC